MKILLTGGSGFVGKHLIKLLGDDVLCVKRNTEVIYSNDFLINTLDSQTNWTGAFDDIDCVIHLAGLAHSNIFTEKDYRSVNVDGTLQLANQAAKSGVKRFVFVSSIGVNGKVTKELPFTEGSIVKPHNIYAESKYQAELGLRKISSETGLEFVIVRPTLVYGYKAPGNFGSLLRLVQITPFLPFGYAKNKRNFISVQNLADLLFICAKHPKASGHTFLASDGPPVSIKEFTNAIAKGINKSLIQIPIPTSLMRLLAFLIGKSTMSEQLLDNLEVDSSNAYEVLGWKPPYSMEQAMHLLSEKKK